VPAKPVANRAMIAQEPANPTEATETPSPLVFWIPRPPDNANARGHSRQANRTKLAYWRELEVRKAARVGFPDQPAQPLARFELHSVWHYKNRRNVLDPDNAIRRLKPVCDFLKREGYIAGDTWEHVRWFNPEVSVTTPDGPPMCSVRVILRTVEDYRAA
jgi:hypothetical protein